MSRTENNRRWRRAAVAGMSLQDALVVGHILVYIGSIIAVLFYPNIDVSDKAFYVVGLIYAGAMTTLLSQFVRFSEGNDRRLCNLLLVYFSVAFIARLPFVLYLPWLSWASSSGLMNMSTQWVIANLPATFGIFLIGYSGFVLAIFLFLAAKQSMSGAAIARTSSPPLECYRLNRLMIVISVLMIGKWVLGHYFAIGVSAVYTAGEFLIPGLHGVLSFLVEYGLLYLLNLGLLVALASKRPRIALIIGLYIVAFVGMDIIFSYKRNIAYEPFILFWICIINWQWLPKRMVRYALITIVVLVGVGLPVYKYVNIYRWHIQQGSNIALAIQKAQVSQASSGNSVVEIYQRIAGLGVLEAATQSSLNKVSGGGNPLTADVQEQFKQHVLGAHQELRSQYGFTQIGRAYVLSGYVGTFIYMMILAIAYFWIYGLALRYLVKMQISRSVLSVIMAIIFVHFTMRGAGPMITIKTLIVLLGTAFFAEKLLRASGRLPHIPVRGRKPTQGRRKYSHGIRG